MKLVLFSTDLMISSLVSGAVRSYDLKTTTVNSQSSAIEACRDDEARVLVVDLRAPGLEVAELVQAARRDGAQLLRIVAFGPHVHEANLAAAREAGCDAVVTRGQFDREASQLIGEMLKE